MKLVIFTLVVAYAEDLSRYRHTDKKFHDDTMKAISGPKIDKYAK